MFVHFVRLLGYAIIYSLGYVIILGACLEMSGDLWMKRYPGDCSFDLQSNFNLVFSGRVLNLQIMLKVSKSYWNLPTVILFIKIK